MFGRLTIIPVMLFGAYAIFSIQQPSSSFAGPPQTTSAATDTHVDQAITLGMVAEILDAVHSELVLSGLCKGGESIQIAMHGIPDRPRVVELVYRVPDVLQIYRWAYIQSDGLVLLADDLYFRDVDTRWSTRGIVDEEYSVKCRDFPIRIEGCVAASLSPREKARHSERETRKRKAMQQP